MSPIIEVRNPIAGDIEYLAAHLRAADVMELEAASGQPVYDALSGSMNADSVTQVVTINGNPASIFGSWPTGNTNIAGVWMAATEDFFSGPIAIRFVRECKAGIISLMDRTGTDFLTNAVDVRNKKHIRWLKWCGAEFEAYPQPFGKNAELFLPFVISREGIKDNV
jgi:hypothetical protein